MKITAVKIEVMKSYHENHSSENCYSVSKSSVEKHFSENQNGGNHNNQIRIDKRIPTQKKGTPCKLKDI